jgi:L-threonylcarbamoyladenylate synthase
MKTRVLKTTAPEAIPAALDILLKGGLIAFPTDTVYGLGTSAFDSSAVETIYTAKSRPIEKAIPVLIGNQLDLVKLTASMPDMANRLIQKFWPGALTIVVLKNSSVPPSVSSTNTVAIRMPDHPFALVLLKRTGPLAVTSANISNQPNPTTAEQVLEQLDGRIDLVLDGGQTPGGQPSTLVDCTGSRPLLIRAGPISDMEIITTALD